MSRTYLTGRQAKKVDGGESARIRAGALFLALLQAKWKSDFEEAAAAQQELNGLGITVKFHRRYREITDDR